MADTRILKTVQQDVSTRGSVALQGLSVKAGMPSLDALQDSSCHLEGALDLLGDIAVESKEWTGALYAAIASASIAKALLDSVVAAICRAEQEASHV